MRLILVGLLVTTGGLLGQVPDADRILETARYVATLRDTDLTGQIRKQAGGKKVVAPVALFLRENQGIEFQVYDGKVWNKFQLKPAEDEYELFEGVGNKIRRFPDSKVSKAVMGTDLSYEDLSMRFLYWPGGQVLGEENLGIGKDAWKVRLVNPQAKGRYKTVDVWVHKKSGALMKIQGYLASGECVKRFQVTDIMNVGGGEYSLKTMKVESFSNGRATGITYLEFDKPKVKKPQGLQ